MQCIVPGLATFLSSRDIASGEPWHERIREELRTSQFGILCVTSENLESHWMLFEAGALAHDLQGRICAILFDGIRPTELPSPLAPYQHRSFEKGQMQQLAQDLAAGCSSIDQDILEMTFAKWWPDLLAGCDDHHQPTLARGRFTRVMSELWIREKEAEEVWVFSPNLYHDLFNPECKRAVERNRARGVKYRYIIPDTEAATARITMYSKNFDLESDALSDEFLRASGGATDLSGFLIEIVIYDPHSSDGAAFGYHPSSHHGDDNIVAFSKNVSQHFITQFQQLWADAKGATP